jgi:hypothetical protein
MRYRKWFVGMFVAGVLASTTSSALASTFSTIDVPGASSTSAIGINERGDILGSYEAGGIAHGFLLDHGTFSTIDVLGSGINNRGDIVGVYIGADFAVHGFLLEHGTFITIDVPGAIVTQAFGINNGGQIVGWYIGAFTVHGFLLEHGTFSTIDVPGAIATQTFGINNRGDIVGFYIGADGISHGFVLF